MRKFSSKILGYVGKLSIYTLKISANTTCNWISHQPKTPDGFSKFKNR